MGKTKVSAELLAQTVATYQRGLTLRAVAAEMGVTPGAIRKRLKMAGVPTREALARQTVDVDRIRTLYLEGYGTMGISKVTGYSESVVRRCVIRLGIMDSSRQFTRQHATPSVRNSKRRPHLFGVRVKRLRFSEERGICQWCHECIAPRWDHPDVTYHHITPIDSGGTGTAENCMVLHRRCHEDPRVFRILHEGRRWRFKTSTMPIPPHLQRNHVSRCPACGAKQKDQDRPCRWCAFQANLAQAKPLLEGGRHDYFEIARILKVTHRTVCNYARRLGLRVLSDKSITEE